MRQIFFFHICDTGSGILVSGSRVPGFVFRIFGFRGQMQGLETSFGAPFARFLAPPPPFSGTEVTKLPERISFQGPWSLENLGLVDYFPPGSHDFEVNSYRVLSRNRDVFLKPSRTFERFARRRTMIISNPRK